MWFLKINQFYDPSSYFRSRTNEIDFGGINFPTLHLIAEKMCIREIDPKGPTLPSINESTLLW